MKDKLVVRPYMCLNCYDLPREELKELGKGNGRPTSNPYDSGEFWVACGRCCLLSNEEIRVYFQDIGKKKEMSRKDGDAIGKVVRKSPGVDARGSGDLGDVPTLFEH